MKTLEQGGGSGVESFYSTCRDVRVRVSLFFGIVGEGTQQAAVKWCTYVSCTNGWTNTQTHMHTHAHMHTSTRMHTHAHTRTYAYTVTHCSEYVFLDDGGEVGGVYKNQTHTPSYITFSQSEYRISCHVTHTSNCSITVLPIFE